MRKPTTVASLNELGRVRLSPNFFMREFLYSEIANLHGIPNIPDHPDRAIEAGRGLCQNLLEPLNATFGRVVVRSGYRSPEVNGFGNAQMKAGKAGYSCSRNEANYGHHIWDRSEPGDALGATATIVIPWFVDRFEAGESWVALAWWIHDHLPYGAMTFFPKLAAFNLHWSEKPERRIDSYAHPNGLLTKPGMPNHEGNHSTFYPGFPKLIATYL